MAGRMWAGVARVDITPPVGVTWQGGYAARKQPAEGIHDPLYATALVCADAPDEPSRRVALLTADIIGLTAEQVASVRQLIGETGGVAPEQVLICCSHTHGGPALMQRAHPPVNATYIAALAQQLAGVVQMAAASLQPVAMRLGHGAAAFNVNRRLRLPNGDTVMRPDLDGLVDHTVSVARLDLLDAASPVPLALLFRFSCHPTSMGGNNYLFTADYPGAARRCVERVYTAGDVQARALFLPGCFGNVRPNFTGPEGGFRSATWPELDAIGRQLGGAVLQAAEEPVNPAAPPAEDLAGPVGSRTTMLALPLESNDAGMRSWPAEVQVMRLGGLFLVGLPGEIFLEIGLRTQREVAAAVGVPPERVLVQGYSNASIGYVPSAAAIPEGGYEVGAWKMSERPAGYTGEAEPLLARAAVELAAVQA